MEIIQKTSFPLIKVRLLLICWIIECLGFINYMLVVCVYLDGGEHVEARTAVLALLSLVAGPALQQYTTLTNFC